MSTRAARHVGGRIPTPHPADWDEIAPTLTIAEAVKHYGVTRGTLQQWEYRTGVLCIRIQPPVPRTKAHGTGVRVAASALAEGQVDRGLYRRAMAAWK